MLYKGNVFRKYLIDRCAMGFTSESIIAEFKAAQGADITEAEIEKILQGAEEEIKKREQELMHEFSSSNFLVNLNTIRDQLTEVRQKALEKNDFKSYAQLTNSLLKAVETLISVSESFKNKLSVNQRQVTTNNFLVLTVLEKDGLIQIPNRDKFIKALGLSESDLKEADMNGRTGNQEGEPRNTDEKSLSEKGDRRSVGFIAPKIVDADYESESSEETEDDKRDD
jgi:hypothetical protein